MSFVVLLLLLLTGAVLGWSARTLLYLRENEPKSSPIPRPVLKPAPTRTPIDRAFDALDHMETGAPVPPIQQPKGASETPLSEKIDDPDFPCDWLSKESAPGFTLAQCRGVCYQPQQRGKLCFWSSQSASQCPHFRARVRPRPAPLR